MKFNEFRHPIYRSLPSLLLGSPPRFHDRAKSINRPSYDQPTIGPNQFKSRKQPERVFDNRSEGEIIGSKISLFGDVLATTGYVFAPFTLGQSLIVSPIGEAISMGGKGIEHYFRFEENGATEENLIDFGVDISVELIPAPLEHVVKKSTLGNENKHLLRSEIGKVKQVSGYGINKTINENRSDNENTDEN